jgi:hypothetical protein
MTIRTAIRLAWTLSLGAMLAAVVAPPLGAQSRFSGDFLLGFRTVNTSGPGAAAKYREDLNLRGGARLYNLNLSFTPDAGGRKLFDRFDLTMVNLGGDPYETISARLQKYGKFLITYDHRKSAYFYKDLTPGDGGTLYDLHTFDFDRVSDSGSAKIWLTDHADVYFAFDRFTRKGAGATTQDIGREVFQFDKPVQEESRQVAVGVNLHFNRYTFSLEEKYLNFKNDNSYFLPGATDGGAEAVYPTMVNDYFLNQPYELKTTMETFRFTARPFDRLFLSGSGQLSNLDEDLSLSETGSGINELDRNFSISSSGPGRFERNMQRYEFGANYLILRRLSIIGAVRYQRFDQTGSLTVDSEAQSVDFGFRTLGVDAGLQYEFTSRLVLTLGYRFENRKLDNLETATFEFNTVKNGGFGNLRWDVTRRLKLTLDYEHSSYEDPFTLISPTSFDRLRATAKYQMGVFSLTATYLYNNSKSDIDEDMFKSSRNQFGLRAGYHGGRFKGFVGYTYLQAKRQGLRTVSFLPFWTTPGGTFLWDILYEGKASLFDANLSCDLNQAWKIGGWANYYSDTGSYDVRRTMVKVYLEYSFMGGYCAQVGYRYADFKERVLGFNNYQANIVEFSFGYRWK